MEEKALRGEGGLAAQAIALLLDCRQRFANLSLSLPPSLPPSSSLTHSLTHSLSLSISLSRSLSRSLSLALSLSLPRAGSVLLSYSRIICRFQLLGQ